MGLQGREIRKTRDDQNPETLAAHEVIPIRLIHARHMF